MSVENHKKAESEKYQNLTKPFLEKVKGRAATHRELEDAIIKTAKAFGGCLTCYGKGYVTIEDRMHPCRDCDRGEAIQRTFDRI